MGLKNILIDDGRAYFEKQEEDVSNKYMSADGSNGTSKCGQAPSKRVEYQKILLAVVVVGALIYAIKNVGFKPQIDKK